MYYLQALEAMETLASQVTSLHLVWVKAHVNIEGNEEADKAAKEGASKGITNKTLTIPRPWTETKQDINNYIQRIWTKRWQDDDRFNHTKQFYGKPNKKNQ